MDIINKGIYKVLLGENGTLLDKNNVMWKFVDDELVGKRSVWTLDWRACWLEDTTIDNVKTWWCDGPEADYEEVFIDLEQIIKGI